MDMVPLILCGIGLALLCLFILLFALKLYKKSGLMKILTIVTIVLSLSLICIGTVLFLLNAKNSSGDVLLEESSSNSELTLINASYSDLSFSYAINSTSIEGNKETSINIRNTSDFEFNGTVTINVLADNKSIITTLQLPVKKLSPSGSKDIVLQVSKNTTDITCSFIGDFSNVDTLDVSNYNITNMSFGNNYFRFEVFSQDQSLLNYENICEEFKSTYTSNLCQGFLLYFIPTKESTFLDANAEFFFDTNTRTTTLTTYSDNKTYQIS